MKSDENRTAKVLRTSAKNDIKQPPLQCGGYQVLDKGIQLVKQTCHFLNHIVIDVAVAGECLGAFAVAGELTDKIRVFDFFVEVADEGAS